MRGGHILLNKLKSMISVFHKAFSRLSDSEEDAKEKGMRKVRAFSIQRTRLSRSLEHQNLGQSGSTKIPDRLGFSRHMKTRLKELEYKVEKSKYKTLEAMLSRIKNKSELPVGK